MIRINWQEIRQIHRNLQRRGVQPHTELQVHVYYLSKDNDSKETKVTAKLKFKDWMQKLFEIEGNHSVTGVIIADGQSRVIWKIRSQHTSYNEEQRIPLNGHKHIVRDFGSLEPTQKEAWIKMTEVALQEYMQHDSD